MNVDLTFYFVDRCVFIEVISTVSAWITVEACCINKNAVLNPLETPEHQYEHP